MRLASRYSLTLMRFVLAFLAVLALLVNPVTAAAAQVACGQGTGVAMAGMDMPMTPAAHMDAKGGGDPCCPHGPAQKSDNKSCAMTCATACAVAVAAPAPIASLTHAFGRAPLTPHREAAARPYRPPGPERPPKSMA